MVSEGDNLTTDAPRRALGLRLPKGFRCRADRNRIKRRGAAVGLLLLSVVFLGAFAAAAVNVSRLAQVRSQLESVCKASALAGATELLDEGALYGYPDVRDDVLMAREAARQLGKYNLVDGRPVTFDPNQSNRPDGDVVVGFVDPLSKLSIRLGLPADPYSPGQVNTVRVTARMNRNVFTKVSLWLGGLTGMCSSDIASSAQATIDRRVSGFRPEHGVKVPVVPLVAEYEGWMHDVQRPAVSGENDCFTVNRLTGEVSPGADGVPEIVLSSVVVPPPAAGEKSASEPKSEIPSSVADKNELETPAKLVPPPTVPFAALDLFVPGAVAYIGPVRCREGLSREDLAAFGGELVIRGGMPAAPIADQLPEELPYGLMDIIGQSRAWPLAEFNAAESSNCRIVGFAAGRVVAVRRCAESSAGWEVVVQPTVMVSSQAVTDPDMNSNPWIAKLELTQ